MNYWPDISLDEHINLKERVESRMMIADVTATGDDNVLSAQANDVSYRKEQLRCLQEEVIELEDLKTGVSITDLGLSDFRMDLLELRQNTWRASPHTQWTTPWFPPTPGRGLRNGVIFRFAQPERWSESAGPLAPAHRLHLYYLVYINRTGEVIHDSTEAKRLLDLVRTCCKSQDQPITAACLPFNQETFWM